MVLYYIGHSVTQLAHVQAFVLLASFLASINSLPQSWLMCGQAVRISQDLGLHVSHSSVEDRETQSSLAALSATSSPNTDRQRNTSKGMVVRVWYG
jgi:hypothetical protein